MVPCGCYGNEGTKVVNLTKFLTNNKLKKNCLYLKFANNCVQETTYALWLKKQREGLHQKTAIHLESQAHKCRSCGGGAFLPYSKNTEQESSNGRSAMSMYIKQWLTRPAEIIEILKRIVLVHGLVSNRGLMSCGCREQKVHKSCRKRLKISSGGLRAGQNNLHGLIVNSKPLNNNAIGYRFPKNIIIICQCDCDNML